jgi:hypothetical protein
MGDDGIVKKLALAIVAFRYFLKKRKPQSLIETGEERRLEDFGIDPHHPTARVRLDRFHSIDLSGK